MASGSGNIQDSATSLLGGIPFGQIIGGPLKAAVDGQGIAAMSTIQFIQAVGFDENGNTQNVSFTYSQFDASTNQSTTYTLTVPLLVIVPIPFIAVDNLTINFTANITANTDTSATQTTDSEFQAKLSASASYLWFSANLNASYSNKSTSTATQNSKYDVQYTMNVTLNASQSDMPGGMLKMLNILNNALTPTPGGNSGSN